MVIQTKTNYRLKSKLEVFYTGGPAQVSGDGKLIACACGDQVKVRACARRPRRTRMHGSSRAHRGGCSIHASVMACSQVVELATGAVVKTFEGVSPRRAAPPNRAPGPRLDAPERRAGPWRPQDSEPITALALSRDGTALYTASRSLQVKRWDVETGRCVRTFKASGRQAGRQAAGRRQAGRWGRRQAVAARSRAPSLPPSCRAGPPCSCG